MSSFLKGHKITELLIASPKGDRFEDVRLQSGLISYYEDVTDSSIHLEIDILVVDDDVAIVVEVKSRLTQKEVRQVLNTLNHFKSAFPHYTNYRLYGAVAAIEIDKDVDTYAYHQGLFVIKQSGDSVKISNDDDFEPQIW